MRISNHDYSRALNALGNVPDEQEILMLSPEQILYIHDKGIERFGGEYGIRDQGLFESVCIAPFTSYFGEEQYPSLFDKAAKYMVDFSHYQIFFDGNKRTALSTAIEMLKVNGYELEMTNAEAYHLTMDIANKGLDVSYVSHELEYASLPINKQAYIDSSDKSVEKIYVKVPYKEKEGAKVLGAKWDPDLRSWYFESGTDMSIVNRWPKQDEEFLKNNEFEHDL